MYASDPSSEDSSYACTVVYMFLSVFHIIPANATAPPTTITISLPQPLVIAASPVCKPGLALGAELATPAIPVGVSAALFPAPTTVTAVTIDWPPSGSVLV